MFVIEIMADYKKTLISLTIAILLTFFVFASIQAIMPSPSYSDYCDIQTPYPDRFNLSQQEYELRVQEFNQLQQDCQTEYDDAKKRFSLILFIVSSILSLIAIFVALYFMASKDKVTQIVMTGILLGGLISLFVGTIWGWQGINNYIRPLVLLAELILVIFLSYKLMKK